MAICSLVEAVQRWIAARVPGGVAVSPKVFLPSLVLFPWSDVLWTVGSATLWCGFFFLRAHLEWRFKTHNPEAGVLCGS
ncbi:uncharacterized protein [Physcomitrium patens]|uniref:Uncharacterized protein n=1 Tax=Physcomitrium patens TaxID=3218 RepID=A0A2K1K4B8_PHYPA|nr:hypothetical protein PHYPA_013087 [Physcomitrium patens]